MQDTFDKKDVILSEGEISCLLVYSTEKHVEYINEILSVAEDALRREGFKPVRLSAEILSDEDYLEELTNLVDDSGLIIIILDGFRPNVIFEFGFAKAKHKPIIILKSKNSIINVKSLYGTIGQSGLSKTEFEKLKNPIIDLSLNLSDFAGKHVAPIDRNAMDNDQLHIGSVIRKELKEKLTLILDEVRKIKSKNINPNILEDVLPYLIRIISFHSEETEFHIGELKEAYEKIHSISEKQGLKVPADIDTMVGSTFINKAEREISQNSSLALSLLRSALKVYEKLIQNFPRDENANIYGISKEREGYIRLKLAGCETQRSHLISAINAFEESLKVNTRLNFPLEYGIIKSNEALAYHRLSYIEEPFTNCMLAVTHYKESMKVYNLESFPLQYAGIQNNLGNVYVDLGNKYYRVEHNDLAAIKNWLLAIGSYSESLNIFREKHPVMYASLLINRGAMYQTMAMLNISIKKNSDNATKDFVESLETYSRAKFPEKFAIISYNLGVTYMKLFDVEKNDAVRNEAIKFFRQASNVFSKESQEFADAQLNLGNVYFPFNRTKNTASDCNNAIKAYHKSLKWYSKQPLSESYGMLWYSIGQVYFYLMSLENRKTNYMKMSEAFTYSLTVFTKDKSPDLYSSIQRMIKRGKALLNET